jgi:deoxyribodipyrimidine photolyase-related protein
MHAANVGSWRDGMLRIPSARPGRRLTLAVAHRAAACEHRRMPDPEIPATRWLFADQLGPWYLDRPGQPVLLIESLAKLGRRRFHRQKLHLVLSALRHRAAELGDQATLLRAATYGEALDDYGEPVSVCEPTSFAAESFTSHRLGVTTVRNPGFATHRDDFRAWASARRARRLLMEDFYRDQRRRHEVLMDGDEPAGGVWNLDAENREPPPKGARTLGLPEPFRPEEDDIDAGVREDLDRWTREGLIDPVGNDGPRWWAATRDEALAALGTFVAARLPAFGAHEDAMLAGDPVLSHSLLSPALNLGLLHPLEVVEAAERVYREGNAPLNSVEGFVRQVLGWREYMWGLYWYLGPAYRRRNALRHQNPVPDWLTGLDPEPVQARCLSTVLAGVRDRGWVHHIPRLMVLGNYGLQRRIHPSALVDWFHTSFVDGYDWVMLTNVIGMSQYADGGQIVTKPYASGGAYINRMSDFCGDCRYDPKVRVGETACPFTAGYWAFLDRNADRLEGNHRMTQALRGRERLGDLDEVVAQERRRGLDPP